MFVMFEIDYCMPIKESYSIELRTNLMCLDAVAILIEII